MEKDLQVSPDSLEHIVNDAAIAKIMENRRPTERLSGFYMLDNTDSAITNYLHVSWNSNVDSFQYSK